MKKIGIITYFYYYNYGTMLQGYALRRAVEKYSLGTVDAEIIDCRFEEKKKSKKQLFLVRIKRLIVYMFQLKRIFKLFTYKKKFNLRNEYFDKFASEECYLSETTYFSTSDILKNPPYYDIYITGSDQTWSPKIGFRESLFLSFAPKNTLRASYAPSIGVASFTEDECNYVKEKLQDYRFVSCRECYGTDILAKLSPTTVVTVLDPTLLIDANEWRIISIQPKINGKYILCYFIGDRYYYRSFAKQLSTQLNLSLIFIPVSYVDFSDNENMQWKAGPKEFLGLIDNAEIVLTDSFHGSIFSINFNKNFYSFVKHKGLDAKDNLRIVDILNRMDLLDRLQSDYNGEIIDYKPIDYSHCNKLLEEERKVSSDFLMTIINATK